MKVCVYLSYIGLGANLLHLAYVHELSKKYGPITILTLCKNLKDALQDDNAVEDVIIIDKKFNKLKNIFSFSSEIKKHKFKKIYIYYPSARIVIACKLAGIKEVYHYPILKKKNLHLVNEAKKFTCKVLKISDCKTFANFQINKERLLNISSYFDKSKFNIVIGAGSSGPTTKWGVENYSKLINKLNKLDKFNFFVLCGPNEKNISSQIINKTEKKNIVDLSDKSISEVIPFLVKADMYVGNDSFGSHISSQSGKPSLVILLDAPKAYTDYSPHHIRIIPEGYDINNINHGSEINPNLVKVDYLYNKILSNI